MLNAGTGMTLQSGDSIMLMVPQMDQRETVRHLDYG